MPIREGENTQLSLYARGLNAKKVGLIDLYAEGDSILDVGCGNGLYPLATSHAFTRICQVDIVDRREPEAARLEFHAMDAMLIEELKQKFSTILCFDIMEHLDQDLEFCAALRHVCDGVLIGSVPASDDEQLRRVGLTHVHHVDKTHRRDYDREGLRLLFRKAGFKDITIMPQWNHGLELAPIALQTESLFSRVVARFLVLLNRLLCRFGVFRNESVSDWFYVVK